MKNLYALLFTIIFSVNVKADFLTAQKNYDEKQYDKAFNEFMVLAKFGNIKSQHNVAVMLLKGQGVKADLISAYAWSKISDNSPKYQELTNFIQGQLSDKELKKAKKLSFELYDKYAHENSKVTLGPTLDKAGKIEIIPLNPKYTPMYPKAMAINRIQGWVDVSFNIFPDGSVRDIQLVAEMPLKAFTKETFKFVEKMKFTFKKDGKTIAINEPLAANQRVDYRLVGVNNELTNKQNQYINNILERAQQGDIKAQYEYAVLYDTYLHKKGEVKGEKVNQWLYNAAIDGIPDAQYRLGKNIYFGKSCKVEKQKGLDWIINAAQIGNPKAQFLAYQMLQNKTIKDSSNNSSIYWLTQAANNGLEVAQLHYAQYIANQDAPSKIELDKALDYLNNYKDKVRRTIQWYQINALVQNKLNKSKKALKSINTALKLAKKAKWDLSELNQQKELIQNS